MRTHTVTLLLKEIVRKEGTMGAGAGTLALPSRQGTKRKVLMLLVISGVIAVAVLAALAVWARGGSEGPAARSTGAHHSGSAIVVTGTGPGLVQIADRAKAGSVPAVTGTGPGLVQIAHTTGDR